MRRLGTALLLSLTTIALASGTAVAGFLSTPPSAGAATRSAPASPVITRSAHIAYLNCPDPDVLLTASIQRRPFVPGQLITYQVSIRDVSHRPCGYDNGLLFRPNPLNPGAGLLGPCGELSVVIANSRGIEVYPGRISPNCPAILGPPLEAGQTVTTTGTWDPSFGVRYHGYGPGVLPGEYRLVIDGKVTLPFDLAGPPFISPPATVPPRTNPLPPSPAPFPLPNVPAPTVPSHPTAPSTPPTTPTTPTMPTSPHAPSRHPVTRSAHVAFDGCSAPNVTLTVTIPSGSNTSAPVRYDVAVHNAGNTPCGTAYRGDPPAVRQFRVGPCSSMPVTFVNALGADVYPGPQVFMCPMFAGPYIAPHTTVSATGTWPGTEVLSSPSSGVDAPSFTPRPQAAPAGKYTLVVDNTVRVPFTLVGTP